MLKIATVLFNFLQMLSIMQSAEAVEQAHDLFLEHYERSPVLKSPDLDEALGLSLWFKMENQNLTGSFKIRGALNAVHNLGEGPLERGVVTHSSGNHGAALAAACKTRALSCLVVTPESTPPAKLDNMRQYGAEVLTCFPEARRELCNYVASFTGRVEIPPFDDLSVIAGQATATKEFLQQMPKLQAIAVPVGGGGLLSGALVAKRHYARADTKIIGCEPELAATAFDYVNGTQTDMAQTLKTKADALRSRPSELTGDCLIEHDWEPLTAEEETTHNIQALMQEALGCSVEFSSAVPLAALLKSRELYRDLDIGVIVTGGNE